MREMATAHTCVFGLGWGDEGKGKVVDLLSTRFDVVVRFNGGANAGHTVWVGEEKFALHLLPTGALHADVSAVIGPGVVVDPTKLVEEIDGLAARGIDVGDRLKISDRAHLVMPYHKLEDQLAEACASVPKKIGTTARGIGPCYADKALRTSAVRFSDVLHSQDFRERITTLTKDRIRTLQARFGEDIELDCVNAADAVMAACDRLKCRICDTTEFLHSAMDDGQSVLFEAANGTLLDINHGTYPYVTSSNTGPHGIGPGAGVPSHSAERLIGVTKAYTTRVGAGPFVSELHDEIGDQIRKQGNEFGTTTGRPRRCGWFDAVATRYTAKLTGATDVAMMHLDTLANFEQVGICVGYEYAGKTSSTFHAHSDILEQSKPVIEFVPGWQDCIRKIRRFEDLPSEARNYVSRVESLVGVPVTLIGVGPERSQTIVRGALEQFVQIPEATTT